MDTKVLAFLTTHKEVVQDHTNRNASIKDCYQALIEIAIATEDQVWSILTTHDVRDFARGLKPKRAYTRHNWDKVQDQIHHKLVRYNGNVKAAAEDLYPNNKNAHQSLGSWIKKNFKSVDHFIVSYERDKKAANKIAPIAKAKEMTPRQMEFYIKMLEAIAGSEAAKSLKQLAGEIK